ncbi:MAG: J domain-containing protein [Rhodospirillales bacterium]|nr:J domain-containing protein [Rhodospirillales bacterium]
MDDPYDILGVARDADAQALRTAYRQLAKAHHPDLNPGDKAAEERFKAISAAHALLSDAEQRAKFDRGEIDAAGNPKADPRQYYHGYADDPMRAKYRAGPAGATGASTGEIDPEDLEDFFARAFGAQGRTQRGFTGPIDQHFTMTVDFLDAARGATRRLTLPDGSVLDVAIPAGLRDGQHLRLKGKGAAGPDGAARGDAIIEVNVAPHRLFRREGDDILLPLPVTLQEAVLGARIEVPTIAGPIHMTIPPNTADGSRLRLKGRGIGGGHQYVEIRVVLPSAPEPALAAFLKDWQPAHPFDPRKGFVV